MKKLITRTWIVVVLTALWIGGAGTIRNATADTLDDGVVFNDPHSTDPADPGNRFAIQNHVIQLIDGTPAGATIRISTYIFASVTYRDALLAAHARGVNVQVLVDSALTDDTSGNSFFGLANGLGRDVTSPSFAVLCPIDRGCIGSGIDHDKFFLFSATSGRTKVVVQTSANMIDHVDTGNSGLTSWNNAVTLVDEPVIYDAYVARFTAMRDLQTSTPYSSTVGTSAKVYFFPRPSADPSSPSDSTVLAILGNIDCSGKNTTGGFGPNHLTSIHVAMFQLSDVNIASKLWALDNAGCVVHVVRTNDGTVDDDAIATLNNCDAHNGVTIDSVHLRVGGDDNNTAADEAIGFVHSKYLVVDGFYNGSPNQRLVWTGSYNYSIGALKSNDEALLKLWNHDAIFNAFQANFQILAGETYQTTQAGTCP
ncbi:MAG TPA: phospholipase D-like domain-containing protein [Kofleriaceae bacterium]|nr:phospholipase D-like domain-containing protein [Kofleriaceae bacterium]